MDHDGDAVTWREKGTGNWARDCGFLMTKQDDLYTLWRPNPQRRVLDNVELAEIERYLDAL
ncbi:MAG: hypothetical protein E6G39_13850 [Actinobacteria bacterium]|jgi:hypothetical protein|nr:MAG: hypothetical protein E6G39_13850 [Actinomycetota bacterium]